MATLPPRQAARVASGLFAGLALFEALLALGFPLGRAAFGGGHKTLPPGLRAAAAFSVGVHVASAGIVLARAGVIGTTPDATWLRRCTWGLSALLGVGVLMNFASRSIWERAIMTPVALTLTACCLTVARRQAHVAPVA